MPAHTMNVLSLFAGIQVGGIDLGLERAGMRTVAQVELDDAARGVLADHWPDIARFTDVGEVTPDECIAAGFVPGRGVIAGGFPCQDLSVAGRRAGLGGARSGLFWEIVRLADALRPQWLLLENVPGLLSAVCPCPGDGACLAVDPDVERCPGTVHTVPGGACQSGCMESHGGAMGTVLGALAELGYGYAYRVLDAQHFGVPQRRRRVFIVGRLGDGAGPVRVLLEPEGCGGHPASSTAAGQSPAVTLTTGSGGGRYDKQPLTVTALTTRAGSTFDDQQTGQLVGALTAGSPTSYHAGPDEAAAGQLIPFDAAQITHPENRVNPQPGDPSMPLAATGQPHIAYALRRDPGGTGQGHDTTYVTHALTSEGHDASEDGTGRGAPLVPVGVGLHGETSYGGHVSASVTGSHGQPPGVIESIGFMPRQYGQDAGTDIAPTLAAQPGNGNAAPAALTAAAVRRLTPRECERLQGFPDDWTATSNGKRQADSPRYRQLGNAVAVPVLEWIGRRIVAVERERGAA